MIEAAQRNKIMMCDYDKAQIIQLLFKNLIQLIGEDDACCL